VRTAYGLTGTGYTGTGSTIAVVDAYAAPTLLSDANRYATNRGDSPFATGQFSTVIASGASPPVGNWGFEQAMDVEAVHAVAPGAKVVYVGARDDQDASFVDAYQRIVDDHLADIVSSSWVLEHDDQIDPGLLAVFEQTFQLGAVTGIGFYAASGDDGGLATAAGSSTPFVSYPAASPWVTAVGGTSLAIGPSGEYRWEAGWETDSTGLDPAGTSWVAPPGAFSTGAGGGRSTRFGEPAYQRGVVPSAISQGRRTVPDIAALADPVTGLLEGASFTPPGGAPTYVEFASGGTSLATPIIAGIQADAQQALGHPIGFANPLLYALSRIGVTHDVVADPLHDGRPIADAKLRQGVDASGHPTTVPTLVTLDRAADAGLVTRRGYDTVTGIGTPSPRYLSLLAARAN
jgi:subtilase family serine protease